MKKGHLSIFTVVFSLFIFCCFETPLQSQLAARMPQASQMPLSSDEAIITPFTASNEDIVSVKMITEEKMLRPSKPFWAAFQFTIAPDWHLYWKNPGESGSAPVISWTLPDGFTVGDILWPFPTRYEIDDAVLYGYSKKMTLLASIYPPDTLEDGTRHTIKAEVQWLACSTLCVPGNAYFTTQVLASTRGTQLNLGASALFRQARRWLPITSGKTKAYYYDGAIEIEVQPSMALDTVKSVVFFPEEEGVIDLHVVPTWQVSEGGKRFSVRLSDPQLKGKKIQLPIKGVLVVKDADGAIVKSHAWNVSITSGSVSEAPVLQTFTQLPSSSVEHIEKLENDVWYRSFFDSMNSVDHSELFKIILFAFIGGLLLNFLPCVLPVISMKMLQLVGLRGEGRFVLLKHGLSYSLGVLVSFWSLVGLIFILQSFGKVVGWGFQLQEPLFVGALVLVLFILGLGMFGVFEFGTTFAATAGSWQASHAHSSLSASFLSGVLATFVASPCTGPLLGTAIGFAATLHPTFVFIVFSSLALGLASPFLLLAFIPGIVKLVPRPGRWLITFKELMGFLLMLTVLWLIWVLDAETLDSPPLTMLIVLFVVAFGVWIYGTWAALDRPKQTRRLAQCISFAVVVFGAYLLLSEIHKTRVGQKVGQAAVDTSAKPASKVIGKEWETFSQEKLDRLLQQKIPVFVAVTAKWCLTCQANHVILDMDRVEEAFVRYGVVKLVADWTTGDEAITKYLRSVGRNGVPLYAVYSPESPGVPLLLSEVVTPDMVIDALKQVSKK